MAMRWRCPPENWLGQAIEGIAGQPDEVHELPAAVLEVPGLYEAMDPQ